MLRRPPLARPTIALTLPRGALLGSTAIQAAFALAFALPALAQPAPNARPQGGAVVAGQASIAHGGGTTTITQSTDRAAINWQSFDVGSRQAVVFQQPAASSVTLNRVTTPRPSEIAGRISANGSVVIINSAGVVFHQGAQVEAQSFVASTADTTNAAFMAGGRLRLDQPGRPGARIENRGNITVRDTGLAALVAPTVANSGTVRARLGTVVLAGAETHTIDLHGDGLVAFDVTSQVRTAPLGPDGRPVAALVTNTGTVLAEGGTVLLTAQAVDGLVQNLVSAGGTIRADSAGARAGMVEIAGVGGSIRLDGTVAAAGRRPGEAGGTVVANATGDVMLGSTARVVANGRAGGGTVALGTSAERARAQGGGVGAGDARRTVVAAGARVRADATERGDGGRVAVIGREQVTHAGAITARGGPQGGDGGRVEVSSRDGFALTGTVDTTAPQGRVGTLLIDPRDLTIVNAAAGEIGTNPAPPQVAAGDGGTNVDATLSIGTLKTLLDANDVRLEATRNLIVNKSFSYNDTGNSLTLAAGNSVKINQALTLKGNIFLLASDPGIPGATANGQVLVNAAVQSSAGNVFMRAHGANGAILYGAGGSAQGLNFVTMVANGVTLPTVANKIQAPFVEIAPNAGVALNLGAGATGGLALAEITGVKAESVLRLGGATLPGNVLTDLAANTTLAGDLTLSNVNLDLRAAGAVSRTAGKLDGVLVLAGVAGTGFAMDGVGHGVGAISPITSAAGRISVHLAGDQTLNTNIPDAPGGFHVRADGALTVAGSINRAGEVALTGASITLDPGFTIKSTGAAVSLLATTGAIELKGGIEALTRISIRADTFTPNGNTLTTTGAGGVVERASNSGGALAVSAVEYALGANTDTLRLGAATAAFETAPQVTAASISLDASPGAAPGFTTLDLRSNGAVTQSVALDLTGVTLAGAAQSFDLTKAGNIIPLVGALGADGGNLALITNGTLSISGLVESTSQVGLIAANGLTVQAGGAVSGDTVGLSTTVAGGLTLNGDVSANGVLELTTAGAVTGTGLVRAATLKGSAGSVDLGGGTPAEIAEIGDFTAQGGFAIVADGALDVAGSLAAGAGAAGNVVLSAETLTVSGSVAAGVAATNAGSITLDGVDQASIGGNLRAHRVGGVGGAIAVGSSAGGVEQTAGLIRADAALTLTAATDITQSGGVLDAAQLLATATGGAIALTGANRLDSIGAVNAGGSITIENAIALGVDGPVLGGLSAAAGALADVTITSAGAMTVNGTVSAGGGAVAGQVSLASEDGFLRGGAASAGRLTVNSGASTNVVRVGGSGGRVALTAESATNGAILVDEALVVPSGGEFALSGRSVTIGFFNLAANLTAPQGRIGIQSDALSFLGFGGARLIAADGTVAIAPRLAGRTVSLGGAGGDLALTAALFPNIDVAGGGGTGVLELGRLDGGNLTVVASTAVPDAPTLRLLSGGSITANAGVTLKVNRLEGQAGGAITLDDVAHDVKVLGALKAGTALAFLASDSLNVDGATSAGTDLSLETAAGTLRVVPGGSLTAGNTQVITLIADQMDFAGAVSAPGGRIEILPRTAGRAMSLAGGGGLALSAASLGQLSAGTLLLGAEQGSAAVAGDLTVGGIATLGGVNRLRLQLKGDVADGGAGTGIVVERLGDATVLAGVNANSISLKSGDNRFGFVDNLDVTAGMTITSGRAVTFAGALEAGQGVTLRGQANDPAALTIAGSVSAGTQGGLATGFIGAVDVATTQGGLAIGSGATVLARNGDVAISATGGAASIANGATVTADGGATLAGNGGVLLAGSLGAQSGIGVTASGGATAFDLAATGSLTTAGGNVALTVTGAATVAGTLTASAGNLVLNGGAVSGAGAVTAGAVTGSATSLALTGAANVIPVLGPFSATGGGIALNTTTPLALAGTVSAAGTVTLDATNISIPVTAQLLAPGQVVTLTSDTGVTGAGVVTAGAINADGGTGAVDLQNVGNAIAGLGDLDAGTFIALASTLPLSITGLVEAPDGVSISAAGLSLAASGTVRATAPGADVALAATAGDLTLAGTVTAPDRVDLFASGTLSQTGGSVTGGVLDAEGATVSQAGGTMEATAGNLDIRAGSASIGGTVRALALGADLRIETKGGDFGLSGTIAADRLLTLIASGALSQTGGSVTGGTVTAQAGGALTQAAGSLASTLGSLEITGASVSLGGTVESARDLTVTATTGALALGGAATAARDAFLTAQTLGIDLGGTLAARDVALTASGGVAPVPGAPVAGRDIAIGGAVTASRTLTLTAQGAATATGALKAATLTGATGGNADFSGANEIANLGPFAAGSLLRLDNARALTVAGANSATGSIALTIAGALVLDAGVPFTLDAPAIALSATSITQPAGAIRTGSLTAKATGGISLEQAGNAISALGAEAGDDVRVVTSTGLAIGADVIGDNLVLTANGGAIAQSAGTIGWTGSATLTALGGITQTGGTLDGGAAGVLTGSAGGAVLLTQAGNVVPRLGAFTAGGGFALATTGDLAVLGNVAAGAGALSLDAGGALDLGTAALSGASGVLASGGDVTQLAGGSLTLGGALDITAAGAVALNGATSAGATNIAAASLDLDAAASLSLTGALVLTTTGDAVLDGSVTATGGSFGVARLTQAAGGTMAFGAGAFDVTATGDVALDGSVSGGAATLATAGFTQAAGGVLAFTGPLGLTAGGDVALRGSLAAAGATLGTDAFTLDAGGSMAIGGPLVLTASGPIVLDGTVTALAATLSGTSLSQAVGGSLGVTGLLAVTTTGDVALNGTTSAGSATLSMAGFALNGGATLSVGGALGLTATGDVVLDGAVTAGSATLSGVAVSQAVGGSLGVANDLGLTATGDVALNGTTSAGSATLSTAGFALNGAATLTVGGALGLTAAGDVVLDGAVTAGSAALSGVAVSQAVGGSLAVTNDLGLTATGDVALSGTTSAGSASFSTAGFALNGGATLTVGGALGLTAAGDVALDGAVTAGSATLSGVAVSQAVGGNLAVTNALGLTATGDVALNGTTTAGSATLATAGFALNGGATLAVSGAFGLTATGDVMLDGTATAGTATIGGASIAQAAGGVLDVAGSLALTSAGAAVLDGAVSGGTTTLNTVTLTQAAGGSLDLGALTLAASGDVTLNGAVTSAATSIAADGFTLAAGGTFDAAAFDLTASGAVVVDGALRATSLTARGATLSQAAGGLLRATGALDLTTTGAMALDGTASGARVSIASAGLTQAVGGRLVSADSLAITATGAARLDGRVEALDTVMNLASLRQGTAGRMAFAALDLTSVGDVLLEGVVSATSARLATAGFELTAVGTLETTGALALTATGDVVLDGSVSAGSATLATGNLSQAAGGQLLIAGPLMLDATGDARLDGLVRATTGDLAATGDLAQAAGGDLRVTGLLTLAAGRDLVLDGTVIADEALVSAGRDLTQAATGLMNASGLRDLSAGRDIILDGRVVGDPIQLTAGRNLLQSAGGTIEASSIILDVGGDASLLGNVTTRLVTGGVGGALVMDGPATLVDRLSALSAGTMMVVEADGALVLDGVLSAPSMIIRSVGPMTVGELTLYTGGVPFTQAPPGNVTLSRLPDPVPGTPGAVLETRDITMTIDSITIQTLSAASSGNATLALRLPATGGRMTFRTLDGTSTDATLDLGSGGYAGGLIALRNLTVLGTGGRTDLEGTIGGIGGQGAAGRAGLGPRLTPEYRINSCPLSSINCVQFVVRLATPADPIRDLGLIGARDEREDPDIFVPNVAERDF